MDHPSNTFDANIAPGSRVEVFVRYADSWASPFEVIDVDHGACHLRRLSDGSTLPEAVTLDRVRLLQSQP